VSSGLTDIPKPGADAVDIELWGGCKNIEAGRIEGKYKEDMGEGY
jgi:hypothetical protein